jgi:cell division septum initiation protein DivIVA
LRRRKHRRSRRREVLRARRRQLQEAAALDAQLTERCLGHARAVQLAEQVHGQLTFIARCLGPGGGGGVDGEELLALLDDVTADLAAGLEEID